MVPVAERAPLQIKAIDCIVPGSGRQGLYGRPYERHRYVQRRTYHGGGHFHAISWDGHGIIGHGIFSHAIIGSTAVSSKR